MPSYFSRIARSLRFEIIIILTLLYGACGPTSIPAVTQSVASQEPSLEASRPTETSNPGEVLLVSPETLPQISPQPLQTMFEELAASQGLILRSATSNISAAITAQTEIVFIAGSFDEMENRIQSERGITFVSLELVGVEPSENLFVIQPHSSRYDESGFIAGYTAALITRDYRIGGIALGDSGIELAALKGFLNGAVFYCGLCRANYPPFYDYPQSITVPSANPVDVLAAVQEMQGQGVETIYLSPGLNQEAIFDALAGSSLDFIGTGHPGINSGLAWAASITPDLSEGIRVVWDSWMAGEEGREIKPPLTLIPADDVLLSPGRVEHIKVLIDDLASGKVDTAVNPLSGESR